MSKAMTPTRRDFVGSQPAVRHSGERSEQTRNNMNNDMQLQRSVQEELNWEPSVTAAHIGVAAKDGVITLSGHVTTYVEKYAAEKAAGRVKGVKAVAEELEVRLPFETKRTDDEIAGAAIERLAWDTSVPRDAVKVQVEKGWLTLTGQVDWKYQKDAAHNDLRPLSGVVGVSDQITLKPRPNATDISADIKRALHRSWSFYQDNVSVSATGGAVRLTGTVPTFDDKWVAASTAWRAPGVTGVENNIAVI
jgi:osmotically-inducible protein OsmY